MTFNIYPDAPTAQLLAKPPGSPIRLAANEAMSTYVELANNVGPDPVQGNLPTCFIRIAVSGTPVPPTMQPRFELLAHDPTTPGGSPPPPLDPNAATSIVNAVALSDDVNVGAARAYFSPPFTDNVYLLKVTIEIAGTRLWLRITNTTGSDRQFVWVVADSDGDAQQPWIHTTPAAVAFKSLGGAVPAQPVVISNRGTGPCAVGATGPALAAPYTLSGLPVMVGPNPARPPTVMVGFNAPAVPGDIAAQVLEFVTSSKPDPGPFDSNGHNNRLTLSAHVGNIWVQKAGVMPTKRSSVALAAAQNGRLYAVGGTVGVRSAVLHNRIVHVVLATVEEYDPAADTWTSMAQLPTARAGVGLVAAANGKIYAIGGAVNRRRGVDAPPIFAPSAAVEEYDPATNIWTSKAAMPTARSVLGVAAAANGKIYAIGGSVIVTQGTEFPTFGPASTVEEYDPATNTWATRTPMPTARSGLGVVAASNGRLYAVGGSDVASVLPTVEEYDPATNRWAVKAAMPTARTEFGLAAAADGAIYAVAGNANGRPLTVMETYDPTTNVWAARAHPPTARNALGFATAGNGRMYAVGGQDVNINALAVVEEYTP